MKVARVMWALTLAVGAWAQLPGPMPWPGPARFPAALQLYLELSDAQVDTIISLNSEYQRWAQSKQRRMAQVQQELSEGLAKEPLDPMALGLATAEIEATRRQLQAEMERTRVKIRAVLNERQQPRLKALEDILKLWPIYTEAVQVNLLEAIWGVQPLVTGAVGVPVVRPGTGAEER